VVHGEGLRDLKEPDQLKPVEPLGTRLILVDLRQPGIDGLRALVRTRRFGQLRKAVLLLERNAWTV
jgi:CheY-like chemotaxis protein